MFFFHCTHNRLSNIYFLKICIIKRKKRIWVKLHLRLFHPIRIEITNFKPIKRGQHLTCDHAQLVRVGWVTRMRISLEIYRYFWQTFLKSYFFVFVIQLFPQGTRKWFWIIYPWKVRKHESIVYIMIFKHYVPRIRNLQHQI